jgi:hypothetical protein
MDSQLDQLQAEAQLARCPPTSSPPRPPGGGDQHLPTHALRFPPLWRGGPAGCRGGVDSALPATTTAAHLSLPLRGRDRVPSHQTRGMPKHNLAVNSRRGGR